MHYSEIFVWRNRQSDSDRYALQCYSPDWLCGAERGRWAGGNTCWKA